MVDRCHYIWYNTRVSSPNRVYKGVIGLIQNYIKELEQEVEYLKNAAEELKALNEELEEGSGLYV